MLAAVIGIDTFTTTCLHDTRAAMLYFSKRVVHDNPSAEITVKHEVEWHLSYIRYSFSCLMSCSTNMREQ